MERVEPVNGGTVLDMGASSAGQQLRHRVMPEAGQIWCWRRESYWFVISVNKFVDVDGNDAVGSELIRVFDESNKYTYYTFERDVMLSWELVS